MLVFPNVQIVKIILIDLVSGFTMCISSDLKWTHLNESFSFQKGLVSETFFRQFTHTVLQTTEKTILDFLLEKDTLHKMVRSL